MFNSYSYQLSPSSVRVDITEKRAPTDESVRLLGEMQKAAEDKIQETIRLSDNGFEAVVHIRNDFLNDATIAVAYFSLNGRKMEATASISGQYSKFASIDGGRRELGAMLINEIAKKIASDAIPALMAAMGKNWGRN